MKKTFTTELKDFNELQKKGSWKRFLHLIAVGKVPWILVIVSFVLETVSAKMAVWFPVYQQKITGGDFSFNTILLAILVLLFYNVFFKSFFSAFGQYQWQVVPKNLKIAVYKKILDLPSSFFDKYKSREMISRITTDTGDMIHVLLLPASLYGSIFGFYLMVNQLFQYDHRLAWYVMAIVPIMLISKVVYANIAYKLNIKSKTAESKLVHYFADTLSNIPLVKTFVTENKERNKGQSFIDKLFKVNLKTYMIGGVFSSVSSIITLILQIGTILIGAMLVKENAITIPIWITFYMFAQNSFYTVDSLLGQYATIKQAQGSMNFLSAVMSTEPEKVDGKPFEKSGDIEFKNVIFAYNDKNVIDNVSFTIPKNKKVAIIGASGSGKTTTISLLERLYTVNSGAITVNGVNINDFAVHDYRRHFGYVTQNLILYSGTILDNLKYGVKREVTDLEVIKACEKANIHDFIMSLPNKYETIVEEGATNLSGGEKQRLALANVFLCDSSYLLLDEATSNLDALSESLVYDAINNISKGKTVINISHRISTIKDYDLIIVMDNGKLAGKGTHEELLNSCDLYNELIQTELQHAGKVGIN